MIKKLIILSLVFNILAGIGAPLLAGLEMQEDSCGMACCMMADPATQQAEEESVMDDSCAEMNSCMPSDKQSPQSLDLEAEAPRTKIKIQDVPVTVAQKVTSALGEKIDKFGNHFREVFSNLFESSREKLAEHSILII